MCDTKCTLLSLSIFGFISGVITLVIFIIAQTTELESFEAIDIQQYQLYPYHIDSSIMQTSNFDAQNMTSSLGFNCVSEVLALISIKSNTIAPIQVGLPTHAPCGVFNAWRVSTLMVLFVTAFNLMQFLASCWGTAAYGGVCCRGVCHTLTLGIIFGVSILMQWISVAFLVASGLGQGTAQPLVPIQSDSGGDWTQALPYINAHTTLAITTTSSVIGSVVVSFGLSYVIWIYRAKLCARLKCCNCGDAASCSAACRRCCLSADDGDGGAYDDDVEYSQPSTTVDDSSSGPFLGIKNAGERDIMRPRSNTNTNGRFYFTRPSNKAVSPPNGVNRGLNSSANPYYGAAPISPYASRSVSPSGMQATRSGYSAPNAIVSSGSLYPHQAGQKQYVRTARPPNRLNNGSPGPSQPSSPSLSSMTPPRLLTPAELAARAQRLQEAGGSRAGTPPLTRAPSSLPNRSNLQPGENYPTTTNQSPVAQVPEPGVAHMVRDPTMPVLQRPASFSGVNTYLQQQEGLPSSASSHNVLSHPPPPPYSSSSLRHSPSMPPRGGGGLTISIGNCLVCHSYPRECIVQPCAHTVLCLTCATLTERCPQCNVLITQRTRVRKPPPAD